MQNLGANIVKDEQKSVPLRRNLNKTLKKWLDISLKTREK